MRLAALCCAFGAGAILLVAGCGKTDVPTPAEIDRKEAIPPPPAPPVVPKGAEAPSPVPGQANDHSSPGFKGGGKPEPAK